MVSFSRIRYSEALARYHVQTGWFQRYKVIRSIASWTAWGALAGMLYWKRSLFAKWLQ
jgi:hypothetical protein